MASSVKRTQSGTNDTDISLNDVLPTAASRLELLLLVVLCTDAMRDKMSATFESPKIPSPSSSITASGDLLLLNPETNNTRNDLKNNVQRPDHNYIRNLAYNSLEAQNLKAAATSNFNVWRTGVLRRSGESLKIQPGAVKQAKARYAAEAKERVRVQQYQSYLDWTKGKGVASPTAHSSATSQQPASTSVIFETKLNELDLKTRALILNATLFILLSLEHYSAHSRILLTYISTSLKLPDDTLSSAESNLALILQKSTTASSTLAQPSTIATSQPTSNNKWKIGLAAIAGATLIGVTGGLAAPFLLGAAGTIMGGVGLGGLATLLGATIANPVTVGALFGVLGGYRGSRAMEEFAREVEDFKILPVTPDNERGTLLFEMTEKRDETPNETQQPQPDEESTQSQLRVAIGISGHLLSYPDIVHPWIVFSTKSYVPFALRYELTPLIKFGTSIADTLRSSGYSLAQAGALRLASPAISTAFLPVSLLEIGSILDSPFSIAMQRSDKAGVVLAKALMEKVQGERPVTLVGYSLGARVIYSCLSELAAQNAFGIVENAVLIGAPIPSDQSAWIKMRTMVVGRLVNVYATDDILLAYLYRVRYAQIGIAGLEAIFGIEGVENFNVTGSVKGHGQYRLAVGRVLKQVNLEGLDLEKVEAEERSLEKEDKEEQRVHDEFRNEAVRKGWEDEQGEIAMVDNTAVREKQKQSEDRNIPWSPPDNESMRDKTTRSSKSGDLLIDLDFEQIKIKKAPELDTFNAEVVEHESGDKSNEEEDDDDDKDNDSYPIQMVDIDPIPESHH